MLLYRKFLLIFLLGMGFLQQAMGQDDSLSRWMSEETVAAEEEYDEEEGYDEEEEYVEDEEKETYEYVPPSLRYIDSTKLTKYAADPRFRYANDARYWSKKEPVKQPRQTVSGDALEIALYSVMGLLLLAVIITVAGRFKGGLFSSSKRKKARLSTQEVLPEEPASLPNEIQKAEASGDYRLALRWAFVYLLMELNEHKKINLKPGASIRQYREELAGNIPGAAAEIRDDFLSVSRYYEYSWYGNHSLKETQYRKVMQQLNSIKKHAGI